MATSLLALLVGISIMMTVGVYGLVADAGLVPIRQTCAPKQALGHVVDLWSDGTGWAGPLAGGVAGLLAGSAVVASVALARRLRSASRAR